MKLDCFPGNGEAQLKAAFAAADKLISHQRQEIQGIPEAHPDRIIGDPMLDQFWFRKHSGIMGLVVGGVVGVWGGSKGAMRVIPSLEIHIYAWTLRMQIMHSKAIELAASI